MLSEEDLLGFHSPLVEICSVQIQGKGSRKTEFQNENIIIDCHFLNHLGCAHQRSLR